MNVLALSTSVASLQAGAAPYAPDHAAVQAPAAVEAAERLLADALDCKLTCDVDPDEPPSGTDFHDTVNEADEPRFAATPLRTRAPFTPSRHRLSLSPPIKPPPIA